MYQIVSSRTYLETKTIQLICEMINAPRSYCVYVIPRQFLSEEVLHVR
jgi:hypothetical protein